ncbi:PE domain-containing protein [Nocardia sp. CDC160]|uniref:PE domain-containing protein n=1 Tax=Nocardia sp. CDC160 TaxID=3112166 RepID=UPI002DB93523|nr:PE domain-containing protein [Nocardia sp. CDC160]MEC3920213.1 PE domain-containing protein [Nocardia sp. CDC160]
MALDIIPDQLPGVSASQTTNAASLASVVGACVPRCAPVPAAADLVSTTAAMAFGFYAVPYYVSTTVGVDHLIEGAQVLVPISTTYLTADVVGGAEVGSGVIGAQA